MVRDWSGVIRYAISGGHGSGGGYLSAIGRCAYDARSTLHTLGSFIYFLYSSSKIAYLGSYTFNTAESVIIIYVWTRARCCDAHNMHD